MIAQAKDPTLAMLCPSPLVLFGIDNRGKPKSYLTCTLTPLPLLPGSGVASRLRFGRTSQME